MTAQMNDNGAVTLKEALHQFVEDYLQGQQPDIDQFVQQYPQHEAQLRKRIQDLREIDTLFDSIFQAEGNEFEGEAAGDDLVGRKVGGFEIVKLIGRGGMGIVYLARDTKLKRSVAVKSLPFKIAGDSDSLTRFRTEAEILASLNHPNIAVIHEIIEQDKDGSYLVLEYVPGETLTERIAREPLKLEEALSLSQQIAEAIAAAHKKGIVHRDLKPGNIKITPEGRVKVLDFGLAKPSLSEDVNDDITGDEPSRIIGTPAYMSPEQANGKDADYRTDIWSFGCILYQMLTAHLPFEGETATDTLAGILKSEPDWDRLPQNTPANIRTLLRGCLEKDPDRRIGDITDASIELTNTLNTPPLPIPVRLRRMVITLGITVIIVLSGVVVWFGLNRDIESSAKVKRLVVLPFENLGSANKEDYSSAISAEIISHLVGIHGLAVSSEEIAENRAMLLGKKSGIDYVLKGTVQCVQLSDPNSWEMRIRPQLIRVSDGQYVWMEPYDKDMSQIHHIPSELAERVTQAMDITLLETERRSLASMPTENTEAYNYYVRGNEYSSRPYQDKNNLIIAIQMYGKAVELDPLFALAHAKLSHAHSGMYFFNHDRSEERLAMAWEESRKALELDPELPEAHWARGVYYYWGRSEYDKALEELEIARKSQPNNSRLLSTIGYVQRRQGQFKQALSNIKKAFGLSPVSFTLAYELGNTFRNMGRYPEAAPCYERAIRLAPDEYRPYLLKANLYLVWKKSTEEARSVLERASRYINIEAEDQIVHLLFRLDFLDGKYQEALDRLPLESPTTDALSFPDALRYAEIYGYTDKTELAKEYYEKAQRVISSKIEEDPNNAWYHSALGATYAGLGRKDDAIREGMQAVQLQFHAKDLGRLFFRQKDLAYIYTMVGDYDKAIEQLELLPSIPGALPISWLQLHLDPAWKPLRNHPRFQKLIEQSK